MFVVGVVAGGGSSRLGVYKACLDVGGFSVADLLLRRLCGCDVLVVCVREGYQRDFWRHILSRFGSCFDRWFVIRDVLDSYSHPVVGLFSILDFVESLLGKCFVAVVSCDNPFVSSALLRYLVQECRSRGGVACVPVWSCGCLEPFVACYSTAILRFLRSWLRRLLLGFSFSMSDVVRSIPGIVYVSAEEVCRLFGRYVFLNINSLWSYLILREYLSA
ncbi:MAG: hypothetical protein DRJ40_06855 [Thermoprotei archaeon]|nr:MAG: hypothetical protein DRJ40_06855 [Thermoprotei archaeon]